MVGCGQVTKVPDAQTRDGPKADAATVCLAPKMTCGPACIDPLTDNMHCGMCTNACSTPSQGCLAGNCVDATASCAVIHTLDPAAIDGPYTHAATGQQFFCDMTHGLSGGPPPTQYEELGMGIYSTAYAGFTLIDALTLQDPIVQQAFIWLFDHQNGVIALAAWTAGNVCMNATAAGGVRLEFGASLLFPAQGTMTQSTYALGALYTPALVNKTPAVYPAKPIGATFFTSYPPTNVPGICSDINNPSLFFKRHP